MEMGACGGSGGYVRVVEAGVARREWAAGGGRGGGLE